MCRHFKKWCCASLRNMDVKYSRGLVALWRTAVLCLRLWICVRHFSVRGQSDARGGGHPRHARCGRRGSDGAVPARRPARPEPAAPDGFYARAAVPAGAGVRQGELRLQTAALRAGHGAQPAGDDDKGTAVSQTCCQGEITPCKPRHQCKHSDHSI